ncbi:MAG: RDD family protein [Acidimicrobiaceae bacterium]|nr:RDD family protein [Ilumatobacter sp.]MCB9380081.1 RDD family protein [Acidimicrobiaceae bacterium]MCO5330245.1 RDD family protein [Ilumatobacteraceae bacterium]
MGTSPDPHPAPQRVAVGHLRPDQVRLLHSVLRAGDVPAVVSGEELVVADGHRQEVDDAIRWVLAADGPPPDEGEDDDPTLRKGLGPLVPPSRPPLRDGRRQATRYRRLAAGTVDGALFAVPTLLAVKAGASPWVALALHAAVYALPTVTYGWTLGKLWTGLRLVGADTMRAPSLLHALLRWVVSAAPLAAAIALGAPGDVAALALVAVDLPILWDLRGLHDRAAGTVVVERSVGGPGIWVRRHRSATMAA